MDSTTSVEYPNSQMNLFMAGITRDLDEHVQAQGRKYAFDFEAGRPLERSASTGSDYKWVEISHNSNSEVAGKKLRSQVSVGLPNRHSTAITLHGDAIGSPGLGDHAFSHVLAADRGTDG